MSESFDLSADDHYAVSITTKVARRLLTHPGCAGSVVGGLRKALAALERMPEATPGVDVEFGVCHRAGAEGQEEMRYVDFRISENEFEISIGGTAYSKEVGGDSFSEPGWLVDADGNGDRDADLPGLDGLVAEYLALGAEVTAKDDSDNAAE